jgi:N-acetylglutamate synthase-like GNAT family acetyltransferase
MKVIEYFLIDNQEYWLTKIKESDWIAGQFLYSLLKNNKFHEYAGANARVFMLVDVNSLISFCSLSDKDDIDCTDLMPWIGFVYTFPQYRGHRYVGELLNYVAHSAKKDGYSKIYVSTDQEGIYEKYKFEYIEVMKDIRGGESRVYVMAL